MEKCLVCKKELRQFNGDRRELCKSCLEFFEWKYKNRLKKELERFKKDIAKEDSIKFQRKK